MQHDNNDKSEKKVGIYICHCGGNISDHVDVERLAERLKAFPAWRSPIPICSCVRTVGKS